MTPAGEHFLEIGPSDAAWSVVVVPPLFDEANRLRRTLVLMMRALVPCGVKSMLPDLPGQNDSLVETSDVTLAGWRDSLAQFIAAQNRPVMVASFRGGTLIDESAAASAWWRLVPVSGASLLRTMLRTRVASDREAGVTSSIDGLLDQAKTSPLLLAGNNLSPDMVAQLGAATAAVTSPMRTVLLGDGPDAIAGTPLWLRAEPGEDSAMANAMAADIIKWARQCGIC